MGGSIIKKNIQFSYAARFMPDITVPPNPRREHCVASLDQIKKIGTNKGQQVRIERSTTANDTTLALYTIKAVHKK